MLLHIAFLVMQLLQWLLHPFFPAEMCCVNLQPIACGPLLQALWRGYKVRKACGRASRDARRRIAAASAAVQPQRRIGVRTREALNVLLASKQCSQVGKQ
jgi:hypothetical protein